MLGSTEVIWPPDSSPAAALSLAEVHQKTTRTLKRIQRSRGLRQESISNSIQITEASPFSPAALPLCRRLAERRKAWNHRGGKRGRMEAAWACAVDRAADMADSARRFFLSLRRPQQPPPPPPPPPSPNPVSELTPFSLRSLITNASAKA